MSRVELFEKIRGDRRRGASIRELADRHGVHRRTVRQAITDAVPPPRKTAVRDAPVLGPSKDTIRGWLQDDLGVPRKQRHTARRMWQRLVSEYGAVVAESTVRRFVAGVKAELASAPLVAVPQTHGLGEEAEVDFGEFHVWLDGTWTRLWLFVMRLSASSVGVINQAALRRWAQQAEFKRDFERRIHGLGIAVFQWLVMRQGVETVKPDVHVRRFAESAVSRSLTDQEVVNVVTRAAEGLGVKAYELDWRIWEASRGGADAVSQGLRSGRS